MKLSLSGDRTAEVLLFRDVKNADQVVAAMMKGQCNAAFVNPRLLPDLLPLSVAVDSAMRKDADGSRVTKNVYTEIIFNLSPSRNISTALRTFSVNDKSTAFLAVIPNPTQPDVDKVRSQLDASECEDVVAALQTLSDLTYARKIYGIEQLEHETSSTVDSILTRMACRDLR